jgi:hypothetical protein
MCYCVLGMTRGSISEVGNLVIFDMLRQMSNRTVCLGVIHHGVYLCLLCSSVFLFFPRTKSELVKRNDDVGTVCQYIPMPTLWR